METFAKIGLFFIICPIVCGYDANWESLDSRPLPTWYDEAKIGIFLHWGVYSSPSFTSEYTAWFWRFWKSNKSDPVNFMKSNFKPGFKYTDFANKFTTEFFNPHQWVDIFKASGAKYVVLTSKHHEGYALWPSKFSWNWNAKDYGPGRDLLGELATSIRNQSGLRFGVYYSLYEWFHPLYLEDKHNNYWTQNFVVTKVMPELYELVATYKPEIVWSDGDWEANDVYWKTIEFLVWLYNKRKNMEHLIPMMYFSDWGTPSTLLNSPVKDSVVVNDRWGKGIMCKHGGFYTCHDRYNPKILQKRKWENAMTVDRQSWGYRRSADLKDFLTIKELITTLAETVSCGGNILINVGPTHDGRIAPIFEERLRQLGSWLNVNGEAIYKSNPWTYQNDSLTPGVWYTTRNNIIYAIVLHWPKNNVLQLGAITPRSNSKVFLLGYSESLLWKTISKTTYIEFPQLNPTTLPCQWAWILKFTNNS